MERLFPDLLTYGIGGFNAVRHHRYSRRDVVVHYLNLSTNRFAEDPMFKMAMFDYLSTQRVKNNVFVRVSQDPDVATCANRITPEQLRVVMNNRINKRQSAQQGRKFTPDEQPASSKKVLKSINATSSKMWGSNEERESFARET